MRGRFLLALPLIAAALGDAFGQTAAPACGGTQKPSAVAELLFGRKIGGGGVVSEARWSHFVDQEITSRFPGGLSMMDIKGQWRDPRRGTIVREPSKMVIIVLPGEASDHERLDQIMAAYKSRFRQQSVGLIIRPACVLF